MSTQNSVFVEICQNLMRIAVTRHFMRCDRVQETPFSVYQAHRELLPWRSF